MIFSDFFFLSYHPAFSVASEIKNQMKEKIKLIVQRDLKETSSLIQYCRGSNRSNLPFDFIEIMFDREALYHRILTTEFAERQKIFDENSILRHFYIGKMQANPENSIDDLIDFMKKKLSKDDDWNSFYFRTLEDLDRSRLSEADLKKITQGIKEIKSGLMRRTLLLFFRGLSVDEARKTAKYREKFLKGLKTGGLEGESLSHILTRISEGKKIPEFLSKSTPITQLFFSELERRLDLLKPGALDFMKADEDYRIDKHENTNHIGASAYHYVTLQNPEIAKKYDFLFLKEELFPDLFGLIYVEPQSPLHGKYIEREMDPTYRSLTKEEVKAIPELMERIFHQYRGREELDQVKAEFENFAIRSEKLTHDQVVLILKYADPNSAAYARAYYEHVLQDRVENLYQLKKNQRDIPITLKARFDEDLKFRKAAISYYRWSLANTWEFGSRLKKDWKFRSLLLFLPLSEVNLEGEEESKLGILFQEILSDNDNWMYEGSPFGNDHYLPATAEIREKIMKEWIRVSRFSDKESVAVFKNHLDFMDELLNIPGVPKEQRKTLSFQKRVTQESLNEKMRKQLREQLTNCTAEILSHTIYLN